jgi:hypothetical protein
MVSDCDGAGIAAVQGEEEEEIRTYTVTLHYTHDTGDISDTPITYCSGHALHILWLCRIASYPWYVYTGKHNQCRHITRCLLLKTLCFLDVWSEVESDEEQSPQLRTPQSLTMMCAGELCLERVSLSSCRHCGNRFCSRSCQESCTCQDEDEEEGNKKRK